MSSGFKRYMSITAAMFFFWTATTPGAQSATHRTADHHHTVRVITTPQPTEAMRVAVRRCATAPKNVRQACHSLYLRPAFRDIPSGRDIVSECYGQAKQEKKDYPGPRTWGDYLRGCILGNIETP